MYIGFVNGGLEIVWCEYLWVATSSCGGFVGPPPRKFRNMKCSRSDSYGYRPLYSYRAVITWVYIGFVNGGGGLEI